MTAGVTAGQGRSRKNRRWGRSSYRPMSEINVTPFVDVMLVLLIVFMVSAPLLTVGVPVELPRTKANTINQSEEPLVVSLDAEKQLFVQESPVSLEQLIPRLRAITANKQDTKIYVRGDRRAHYGDVVSLMAALQSAGFRKVALITDSAGRKQEAAN